MKKLSVIGALLLTMVMATGCGSKVMTSKNGMTVETPESGWKVQEIIIYAVVCNCSQN